MPSLIKVVRSLQSAQNTVIGTAAMILSRENKTELAKMKGSLAKF